MADKRTTVDGMVAELRSGMTIGIGGWGSRRKPMALVRAICRSDLEDLTVVAYGGPDVGLLCAAGKVRRVVCGFVTLDSIVLDPHWRAARQGGRVALTELDEGMVYAGLQAAAWRVPFLPTRAGLGSDVLRVNPELRTVRSPYVDGPFADPDDAGPDDAGPEGGGVELVAAPALRLDAALVHANRADTAGNAQFLGPDPFFDELFLGAARLRLVTAERVVANGELASEGPLSAVRVHRLLTDAVAETPGGAHFTACPPDYGRDEAFQKAYAASAASAEAWSAFRARYLDVDEDGYRAAVQALGNGKATREGKAAR
ncbi:MAG: CoA transferase subunit A [Acidimicrobiales bacterium]